MPGAPSPGGGGARGHRSRSAPGPASGSSSAEARVALLRTPSPRTPRRFQDWPPRQATSRDGESVHNDNKKRENETERPGRGASCANKLLVGGGKCQDADCKRVTRRERPSWTRPHRPGEGRVRERGGIRTRGHVRALARAWSRRPPCWTWRTRGPEERSAGRSSPSAGIADRLKLHMHSAHRPRIRGTRPARRQGANRPVGPVGHRASYDGTPFRPGRKPCISAACRRQEVDIEV